MSHQNVTVREQIQNKCKVVLRFLYTEKTESINVIHKLFESTLIWV